MPVLPLVASRRDWPLPSLPCFSAAATIDEAALSFTDPPGFVHSAFPRIWIPGRWDISRSRRNKGVLPIRSRSVEPSDWVWSEFVAISQTLQPASKVCESENTQQLTIKCSLCCAFTAMPRKAKQPTFDEILASLRSQQFDVQQVSGVA